MGLLRRLLGLSGGGARRRKHDRRMPRTVAEIDRAWRAYGVKNKQPWRRSVEDASFQTPSGHVFRYKAKILPDTIKSGRTCTFFVTEATGPGVAVDPADGRTAALPYAVQDKPYEVSKLCNGGQVFTGTTAVADRDHAKRIAHDRAHFERTGRYPPAPRSLRGTRRRR